MRVVSVILIILMVFIFAVSVLGQTDSAVTDDKKVEEIKERISSQLNASLDSAVDVETGFFVRQDEADNKFELNYNDSKIIINYDAELLKVYNVSGSKTEEIDFSDLNEKDYLVAFGNKLDNEFHALNLYRQNNERIHNGTVMEVRKDDSSFLTIDELGNQIVVSVLRSTDLQIISEDDNEFRFQKAVFSKIKENDRVVFRFYASDSANIDAVSAEEVIIVPQELLEQLHINN
ncbi:MAG: hypothetical protein KatS3mg091_772 [Patescibacteria group bacterium]|nr:MAG: hypothetical protein KatS3mg091_772 [Patescibacteria group bacterium]